MYKLKLDVHHISNIQNSTCISNISAISNLSQPTYVHDKSNICCTNTNLMYTNKSNIQHSTFIS